MGKKSTLTKDIVALVIAHVRSMGSDATDLRDAAHEACHALDCDAERWDRDSVHDAVWRKYELAGDRLRAEAFARAVERLVCECAGVPYDRDQWMLMAAMETIKNGIRGVPYSFWPKVTERMMQSNEAQEMAARILALSVEDTRG